MSAGDTRRPAEHSASVAVLLGAIALTVFGAHLLLVAALGSPMPFWDQWDAEAMNLYVPYLNGTLSLNDMLAAHNEHRIAITRLLALFHLELAGEWNPRFEMMLNAIIHAGVITWFAALLMPLVAPPRRILFAAFTAFVFALPIGFENTLWGFQSQFYLVSLCAFGTIVCLASAAPFSLRWFAGVLLAALSYLSLSSGAVTVFVGGIVVVLQLAAGVRERRGVEFVALAVLAALGVAMILGVPRTPSQPTFDLMTSINGFIALVALPLATIVGLAFVQGPTIWFTWRTVATRAARDSRMWIAVGIAGWIASQIVLFSYGRGNAMGARYFDVVILAYPIGLMAVLALADRLRTTRWERFATPAAVVWVLVMVTVLATLGYYSSLRGALERHAASERQMVNVGAYLASNDIVDLTDKGYLGIPYPDPQRLADILAVPQVRAILPPEIRPPDGDVAAMRGRMLLKGALAGPVVELTRLVLLIAPLFLALGLGVFFAAGMATAVRRPET